MMYSKSDNRRLSLPFWVKKNTRGWPRALLVLAFVVSFLLSFPVSCSSSNMLCQFCWCWILFIPCCGALLAVLPSSCWCVVDFPGTFLYHQNMHMFSLMSMCFFFKTNITNSSFNHVLHLDIKLSNKCRHNYEQYIFLRLTHNQKMF